MNCTVCRTPLFFTFHLFVEQCLLKRDQDRFYVSYFETVVILVFFWFFFFCPGCHCASRRAASRPSWPVPGRDGCKAALLRNMSRAGEEEVGVESRKGQRRKASPRVSSRLPARGEVPVTQLEHRDGLSRGHQRKRQIPPEMCFVYFFKKRGGGRLAGGDAAEAF